MCNGISKFIKHFSTWTLKHLQFHLTLVCHEQHGLFVSCCHSAYISCHIVYNALYCLSLSNLCSNWLQTCIFTSKCLLPCLIPTLHQINLKIWWFFTHWTTVDDLMTRTKTISVKVKDLLFSPPVSQSMLRTMKIMCPSTSVPASVTTRSYASSYRATWTHRRIPSTSTGTRRYTCNCLSVSLSLYDVLFGGLQWGIDCCVSSGPAIMEKLKL